MKVIDDPRDTSLHGGRTVRTFIDLIKETVTNVDKIADMIQDATKQSAPRQEQKQATTAKEPEREACRQEAQAQNASAPPLPPKFESPSPCDIDSRAPFAPSLDFGRYWRLNYSLLSESEKRAYEAIETAILRGFPSTQVNLPADTNLIMKVAKSLIEDNWSLFYINTGVTVCTEPGRVDVCFHYNRFNKDKEEYLRRMKEVAREVYETRVKGCRTRYEAEMAIHDYLTETVTYDASDDELAHSPVGPLLYKKGVCEGISEAFTFLACSCGIKAAMMSGTKNGNNHRWNIVEIDGERYHLDVTYDLTGLHACFNCDDSILRRTHTFSKRVGCDTTRQNYYTVNGSRFRSSVEASSYIKQQAAKGAAFEFMLDSGAAPSEIMRIVQMGTGGTRRVTARNTEQRFYKIMLS